MVPLAASPPQEIIKYLEGKLAEQQRSKADATHCSVGGTAAAKAGVAAPALEPAAAPAPAAAPTAAADSSDNSVSSVAAVPSAGQSVQREPQLAVQALALAHDPEGGEEACSGGSPPAGNYLQIAEAAAPAVAAAEGEELDAAEQQCLPAVDATPQRQPQLLQEHGR